MSQPSAIGKFVKVTFGTESQIYKPIIFHNLSVFCFIYHWTQATAYHLEFIIVKATRLISLDHHGLNVSLCIIENFKIISTVRVRKIIIALQLHMHTNFVLIPNFSTSTKYGFVTVSQHKVANICSVAVSCKDYF